MSELAELRALADRIARGAGRIQRDRYEGDFAVRTKSAPIDLVTEVDEACETFIVSTLHDERPGDAVLAEEGGGHDDASATWRWIVDPLDGTTNFAHGYPRFCVSIAAEREGVPSVGVVYDPILDELYSAIRGGGAWLNGRSLRVSKVSDIGKALIGTGFAYDVHRAEDDNINHFAAMVKRARGLRRDGSAALDLCYVAAGRFDGFWEIGLHPWDVAAGCLLVEEAGGRTSDFSGAVVPFTGGQTLASNGLVHEAMLEVLRE